MEIVNFLYRKPDYLPPNRIDQLDSIAIHNTGNDNDIHINTDFHMDNNHWSWCGYAYYIVDGIPYKIRGYKNQNAAVKGHNNHIISIAVQGDYNKKIPSQKDMEAVQFVINHLKKKLPQIKHLHGHNYWNQTSCPGKLFPIGKFKLEEDDYKTKYIELYQKYGELEEENEILQREKERLVKIVENRNLR